MFDKSSIAEPDSAINCNSDLTEEVCELCGLPVRRNGYAEKARQFCCPGCRQVFHVLTYATGVLPSNYRETDIFLACAEAGIIPGPRPSVHTIQESSTINEVSSLTVDLQVKGMWCPACAWLIEEVLRKMDGVAVSHVSFFTDTARVDYFPHRTSPAEIITGIEKIGYMAYPGNKETSGSTFDQQTLLRLGISAILTINIMMLSYALYAGFFRSFSPAVVAYFTYPLFAMTVPVVFYGGMPILKKAWITLRHGLISMDTLISVSALSAFIYSIICMIQARPHTYFDTTAMLITIVLFGRYLESRTRARVLATTVFDETALTKVRLSALGSSRWVSAASVKQGDRYTVQKGEYIPVDGSIAAGECTVNQSALTGESRHVLKRMGDTVLAGSLMVDGDIEVTVTKSSGESLLHQMADAVRKALARESPEEELSDNISRAFVPVVFSIAGITAIALWMSGAVFDTILLRSLTILLISCPCTLGIAIPLAKIVSVGLARKTGILIINPEALSKIRQLDTIVLDKTGTLTEGSLALRQVLCETRSEKEILALLAGLEKGSTHFLAREIRRRAQDLGLSPFESRSTEELEGMGVTGTAKGEQMFAGNRRLLTRFGINLPVSIQRKALTMEEQGMTVVFFGWNGEAKGILVFGDQLKSDARQLIESLNKKGIRVVIVSGDADRTTKAVAATLGITEAFGDKLSIEKVQIVKDLQSQCRVVGVAGDGVNDAGALAQADVGFALAPGYEITRQASDFIIPSGNPATLMQVFPLALLSERTTRQNLFFSFLYNVVAIPIAVAGLLNPLIAVCAMFASSLTVTLNTLRLGSISVVNSE